MKRVNRERFNRRRRPGKLAEREREKDGCGEEKKRERRKGCFHQEYQLWLWARTGELAVLMGKPAEGERLHGNRILIMLTLPLSAHTYPRTLMPAPPLTDPSLMHGLETNQGLTAHACFHPPPRSFYYIPLLGPLNQNSLFFPSLPALHFYIPLSPIVGRGSTTLLYPGPCSKRKNEAIRLLDFMFVFWHV